MSHRGDREPDMTVRMSATGPNTPIYERWDNNGENAGWKKLNASNPTCWPPTLTTHDGQGIGNTLIRLMGQLPGTLIPKRFAIRLVLWNIVLQARCPTPNCAGTLGYVHVLTDQPVTLSWSMREGFAIFDNGNKRTTTDELKAAYSVDHPNAETARIGCDACTFRCPALKPQSLRPNLTFLNEEYCNLIEVLGTVRVPMDATQPRAMRTYVSCEMWRLSDLGIQFAEAEQRGDPRQKRAVLLNALSGMQTRNSLPLPERGVESESARDVHVFSRMTNGPAINDCAAFVSDVVKLRKGEPVNYDDVGVFQCYYGRSFSQDCNGCPFDVHNICPLRNDLKTAGIRPVETGCKQNLIKLAEAVRTDKIRLSEHPAMDASFHPWRFEHDGKILRDFDWTKQCSKEAVIPFYLAHALGLLRREGGGRGVQLWPAESGQ